jgi:hypothetical protein
MRDSISRLKAETYVQMGFKIFLKHLFFSNTLDDNAYKVLAQHCNVHIKT